MESQPPPELTDPAGLSENDLASDPIEQFGLWYQQAWESGLDQPDTMVVATADKAGRPSARAVLLRDVGPAGFVFYTDYRSRKGRELAQNDQIAACFVWVPLRRQVRIEGTVSKLPGGASDAYFRTRPRGAQISAAVSPQSSVINSRADLVARWSTFAQENEGDIARPADWGGYRISPHEIEFWQGQEDRLHDRLRYRLGDEGWIVERLAP